MWSNETMFGCRLERLTAKECGQRKVSSGMDWCIESTGKNEVSKETGSSSRLEGLLAKAETWMETGFSCRLEGLSVKARMCSKVTGFSCGLEVLSVKAGIEVVKKPGSAVGWKDRSCRRLKLSLASVGTALTIMIGCSFEQSLLRTGSAVSLTCSLQAVSNP